MDQRDVLVMATGSASVDHDSLKLCWGLITYCAAIATEWILFHWMSDSNAWWWSPLVKIAIKLECFVIFCQFCLKKLHANQERERDKGVLPGRNIPVPIVFVSRMRWRDVPVGWSVLTLLWFCFSVNVTALAAGPQHVLAVGSEGQVFSWGQGSYGRLGLGTDDNQYVM